MHLTDEQRKIGAENFQEAIGSIKSKDASGKDFSRRDFLLGAAAAGLASGAGLGSYYFGYGRSIDNPLRVGVIGTGDEGNVLLGAVTPSYIDVIAIADIRPFNVWRAFHGDHSSDTAYRARCGLMKKYGWKTEDEARKHVKVYDQDYHELLANKDIEAVIIALPLHLHHIVAIEAMKAGKHVLTEKLMGHSVAKCKEMSRMSQQAGKFLVTGHQRHYSILYANAVETIASGLIGDIHHIRAQWHRDNLPGRDSWQALVPTDEKDKLAKQIAAQTKLVDKLKNEKNGQDKVLEAQILLEQLQAQKLDEAVDAAKFGYQDRPLEKLLDKNGQPKNRSALEELIRWRLWNRTGGGLMAELGSHQLDAAGILISAMNKGEKALPLTVSAIGGRHIFPADRECEDHVYCIYEFPNPKFKDDPEKKICVTYSSINGNGYGGYGEVVLGTKGTMILEREQEVMLFGGSNVTTRVGVNYDKDKSAVLDTTHSGGPAAAAVGKLAVDSGPISRGYTEEIEHWAYCIRNPAPENTPRCHPKIALGDAVIALTTNLALRGGSNSTGPNGPRIEFKHEWFEIDSDETPEGVKPDLSQYS